ncbi:hypothetical protein Avbf_11919 [Armadillidium vulgare]|nr:hypothetical protein Avbf_11919 [Armadillidium vulgare]
MNDTTVIFTRGILKGASEHLGYKPGSKNFSLPILPTPRSWTPSPPFPQTSHNQKLNSNHHLSCHNCCKNHCHHCRTHHECFTAFDDASRCQICSFEATRKLSNFQKYCKDIQTPRRPKTEIARSKSTFHLPLNLQATANSNAMHSCPNSSSQSSKKEGEELSNNNDLNKSFSNSVASRPRSSLGTERNKNDTDPTQAMTYRKPSTSIPGVFEGENSSLGSKKNLPRETNENISERPNTPMVVTQESVSSESSDAASALNRSSGTYWKLYHAKESHNGDTKDFGEGDSKYDATEPSMSWDHLAPDLSRSKEEYVEAKAEVDPSRVTAVFHQDKNVEENGSENVNISVQTSSVI